MQNLSGLDLFVWLDSSRVSGKKKKLFRIFRDHFASFSHFVRSRKFHNKNKAKISRINSAKISRVNNAKIERMYFGRTDRSLKR